MLKTPNVSFCGWILEASFSMSGWRLAEARSKFCWFKLESVRRERYFLLSVSKKLFPKDQNSIKVYKIAKAMNTLSTFSVLCICGYDGLHTWHCLPVQGLESKRRLNENADDDNDYDNSQSRRKPRPVLETYCLIMSSFDWFKGDVNSDINFWQGRPSPWGNDTFSPVSDSPYLRKKLSDSVENFLDFTFSLKKFPIFIRLNFRWSFLVIDYKFRISPIFLLFQYISPNFEKIIISPWFRKMLHTFCVFHCPP